MKIAAAIIIILSVCSLFQSAHAILTSHEIRTISDRYCSNNDCSQNGVLYPDYTEDYTFYDDYTTSELSPDPHVLDYQPLSTAQPASANVTRPRPFKKSEASRRARKRKRQESKKTASPDPHVLDYQPLPTAQPASANVTRPRPAKRIEARRERERRRQESKKTASPDSNPLYFDQYTQPKEATNVGEIRESHRDTKQTVTNFNDANQAPQKRGFFGNLFTKLSDAVSSITGFLTNSKEKKQTKQTASTSSPTPKPVTIPTPQQPATTDSPLTLDPANIPPFNPLTNNQPIPPVKQQNQKQIKENVSLLTKITDKLKDGLQANKCNPDQATLDTLANDGYKYNPGCEALAGSLKDADVDRLYGVCLSSLKQVILKEAKTHRPGEINRFKLFKNMLDKNKINPKEQRFLAMIFTSFGETRGIDRKKGLGKEKEMQRFQHVMKVIDNRLKKMQKVPGQESITAMNVALYPKQFSVYNPGTNNNFPKIINYQANPIRRESMKNAVRAYIKFEQKGGNIRGMTNRIYHFVTHQLHRLARSGKRYTNRWFNTKPVQGLRDPHHAYFEDIDFGVTDKTWADPQYAIQGSTLYAVIRIPKRNTRHLFLSSVAFFKSYGGQDHGKTTRHSSF